MQDAQDFSAVREWKSNTEEQLWDGSLKGEAAAAPSESAVSECEPLSHQQRSDTSEHEYRRSGAQSAIISGTPT